MQTMRLRLKQLPRFVLFRCKTLIPWVLFMVVELVLLSLAYWQWSRAEEKTQQLAQWEKNKDTVLSVSEVWERLEAIEKAPIGQCRRGQQELSSYGLEISGWLEPQQIWLLDNQLVDGRTGYDVITMFAADTEDGQLTILLNIGWLHSDYAERDRAPNISLANLEAENWQVQLVFPQLSVNPFVNESADALGRYIRIQTPLTAIRQLSQQLDFPIWGSHGHGYTSALYAVLLPSDAEQSSPAATPLTPAGLVFHYEQVVMKPEKNRAYAVQWVLIAIALLFVFRLARQRKKQSKSE